jgi:hypothetical protein
MDLVESRQPLSKGLNQPRFNTELSRQVGESRSFLATAVLNGMTMGEHGRWAVLSELVARKLGKRSEWVLHLLRTTEHLGLVFRRPQEADEGASLRLRAQLGTRVGDERGLIQGWNRDRVSLEKLGDTMSLLG